MQSPPRNFDSFPKRISVSVQHHPTKISIISFILCFIVFLSYAFANKSKWDLDFLYLSSQWEIWRLLTGMFIIKSGFEVLLTMGLIIGYLGCGAEVKKGSIRTLWEVIFLGTLLNIGKLIFISNL